MSRTSGRVYAITLRKAHTFMKARGYDIAGLLADTELSEADLAEPYRLISQAQARRYYLNLVHLAKQDGFGLDIGWITALSDMGPHGMALLTESTIGDALQKTWEIRDNYNLLLDWQYATAGKLLVHTVRCGEPDGKLRVFLIERGLATIQAHTEELLGPEAKPVRVLLDYKSPLNVDQYKEIFRCPILFSQEGTEIHYPADWCERSIETFDPTTREVLGALRSGLHDKLSARGDTIVQDVKMALRRVPGEFPSLERLADSLAMSSRTLRRKLGQHNVRYQELLDEERRRVAEDFLLNTTMTIQQIADKCGFSDPQNFSSAFRRWRGMSPTQFRETKP